MSYTSVEQSAADAAPVELYALIVGLDAYRYTTAETAVTYQGQTYRPIALGRDSIGQTSELNKSNIKVTVPRDNDFAARFTAAPPDRNVSVTIFRYHRGQDDFITLWKGRATDVQWAGSTAAIQCEPITTSLKRTGLRPRYSHNCRHGLYDDGCRVNNQDFRVDGTLTTVGNNQISSGAWAAKPDGWFKAGYVKTADYQRLITAHSGTTLTLSAPIPGLAVGDVVQAFAGCAHDIATCRDKFDNVVNYGGFPYVPTRNPFRGGGAG